MQFHPAFILLAANEMILPFKNYFVSGYGEVFNSKGIKLKFRLKKRRLNSGFDICANISGKDFRISRLQAHLFYGMPIRSKKHANHINKNLNQNWVSNIEVTTAKQNMRHRSRK